MCLIYKMPNRWTDFVKEWASKNGISYGCALSKPELKSAYHKKYPKPLTKKQQKFREAVERGAMEDEDVNRARKMPSKESKEAFKMTNEDLLSRRVNKEWQNEAKENIKMAIEDKPAPAPAAPTPKKRGRKPKYATEEEKKKAKREQTLASNKKMTEMRKEYLKQGREQLKMAKEDKNVASAPVPKKKSAAQKVFEIPELKREIQSYETTLTKKKRDSILDSIRDDIDYWNTLINVFDTDFVNFKNAKQKASIMKRVEKYTTIISDMKSLLLERLTFLIKRNGLKEINDDDTYYDNGDITYYDFTRIDIDGDGNVGKDTLNEIRDVALDAAITNYKSLMVEMGVSERDATIILNKRIKKNEGFENTEFVVEGKGILKDIRKGIKKATKAVKLGVEQSTGFVKSAARKAGEVVAETATNVGEYGKAVLYGRMDYPPKVRTILKKYGEEVITGYKIKRTPVSKLLTSALSAVSLGVFGKRFGRSEYDELFHLFLEMTTSSGKRISVEKNEVINMDVSPPKRDKEEVKDITTNIPQGLTINAMLAKAEESMGKNKFFGYSARDNNCQDFIVAILKSNNIGDNSDIEFVKQNTKELFKNLPFLRKFANTITDLGARVNVITTGAGVGGEDYIVQSVVFSKDKWTTPKAKKWLKENGYISPKVDRKANTLRFRQRDPDEAEKDGFTEYRTKDLSDSGIQLILSYKKKILTNSIEKMPRFVKGSEEAKEWGRKMREKRGMKGGAIKPLLPTTTPVEASGPRYRTMGKGMEVECECCPTCKRTLDVEMEGGKINVGKAFKKAGRAMKKGIEKEILNPSGKALAPVGEYITKKKGGLATDLIRYGIPAATGTALGLAGTVLGPAQGMVASAIGTKLGAMGAAELQKATGTGMCGRGGGASKQPAPAPSTPQRSYSHILHNKSVRQWAKWCKDAYKNGDATVNELLDHLSLEVMKARVMGSKEEEDAIEKIREIIERGGISKL